jgi:hypothetical protein
MYTCDCAYDPQRKPGPRIVSSHDPDAPPPQDALAEKTVLGAVIHDKVALPRFANLRPEYFFNEANQKIFSAMSALQNRSEEVGYVTLTDELRARGELDAAGGVDYISKLDDGVPAINQANQAAVIIRRTYRQRKMIRVLDDGSKEVYRGDPAAVSIRIGEELSALSQEFSGPVPAANALTLPDMPEAVLDGRLGALCIERLISHGLPIAYAWLALVTAAGTLVPPTPGVPTNIFGAAVGPIGTGKTTAIECTNALLGLRTPQLQSVMAGSAEGLLAHLEDAAGAGRLISVDELAHLFLKATIDKASFPSILNRAYSKTEFDIVIRRGQKVHVNCRLGIIGGVVEDNFQNCFGVATTAGLYDRFVFGQCPKPHKFHYRPFEGPAEQTDPCDVRIDPEVFEATKDWIKENPALAEGRPIELAIRFATIAAAFSGRSVLRVADLGPARAFAEYQFRVRALLRPNPGQNQDAQCAFAILAVLDQAGAWMDQRDLGRKVHAPRFGPGVFRHALENLEFNGEIQRATEARRARVRRLK